MNLRRAVRTPSRRTRKPGTRRARGRLRRRSAGRCCPPLTGRYSTDRSLRDGVLPATVGSAERDDLYSSAQARSEAINGKDSAGEVPRFPEERLLSGDSRWLRPSRKIRRYGRCLDRRQSCFNCARSGFSARAGIPAGMLGPRSANPAKRALPGDCRLHAISTCRASWVHDCLVGGEERRCFPGQVGATGEG